MTAFDAGAGAGANPDADRALRLLANSPVTLYRRRPLLASTVEWLSTHDYQVVALDAAGWETDADLHRDVARALDFPDYYGNNLDALNDCMRDVVDRAYGWSPDAAGLVLVFTGYDAYAARRPGSAHSVLDILADRSRSALLFGRRLLVLVQSDDPDLRFDPVGATPVVWNDAEWLDADRRAERP
jgi:hypothetical protein